jgi:isopenicillin-N epimerase
LYKSIKRMAINQLKNLFLLEPEIVFLNHGSFGATPRPVFEAYQEWQLRLERQPVRFFITELRQHLGHARQVLAEYLHANPNELAFIPNATHGVNIIARSITLQSDDEILASDHEYGACDNAWVYACRLAGARYIHQPVPLPAESSEEMLENLWSGVTNRTRMITLSHITSPTAVRLPVEAICQRARDAGILTFIDGAHAPGQIELNLDALGADFYTGNCHKWLMAPKGSAFLYSRLERQELVEPLVVSWGWGDNSTLNFGSHYLDLLEWTGTQDYSAALSVPAAIRFLEKYDWPSVRARCQDLLRQALEGLQRLTGLPSNYGEGCQPYTQMASALLPPFADLQDLKNRLYDEHHVEVPLIDWNERQLIRISVQGYNSPGDIQALLDAMQALLPQFSA